MAGKSIYPSIPAPGNDSASLRATVDAMRQTLTMVIMNAQNPNPNFTPSSASQIFVTKDDLKATGVVGPQGPTGAQGPPGVGGIAEAPNDVNTYGRHALAWQSLSVSAAMGSLATPPSTTSSTYIMLGLGVILTTSIATRGWISISGYIANSTNNGETNVTVCYGTGTPPANGAALAGTTLGSALRYTAATGGSLAPFSKSVLLSSLTPGTNYWFDLAIKAISGTASVGNLDLAAHGLL